MEGKFGADKYVYGIDFSDGFIVCAYLQTHQAAYIKYGQLFIYQQKQNKTHINE